MDLADCGNPVELAKKILMQILDIKPPIPIREIAKALDILKIEPIKDSSFEGGLITPDDKSDGCILYNESSSNARQRFTIGHELGHFVNPWHSPNSSGQIMCTKNNMTASTFNKNNLQEKMEVEANQFSAEILMPTSMIKKDIIIENAGIELILSLAGKYDVSKESMASRYVDIQDEPSAIVFSNNKKILYFCKNKDFPWLSISKNSFLPPSSLSLSFQGDNGGLSEWEENSSDVWLSESKECKTVYEQVLVQQNEYRMTLLTLGEIDDEEESDLEESYRIKF